MARRGAHPSEIGERLHRLREKAGISARELDKLADITQGHTSLIETSLGERVSAKTLQPLARVLGVTLDFLIAGEGREPSAAAIQAAVEAARSRAA